ncbi:MAG: hypothetical protein MK010_05685 [Erythrobacter sp.]|nr:hypothetical protein [Erythrobacter sp.]
MALGTSAIAQEATAIEPPVDEIVVTAPQDLSPAEITEAIERLVPDLRSDRPVPRLSDPLCLAVAGFPSGSAQALHAAITSRVLEFGLTEASLGCTPNVVVALSDDPAEFIAALRKKQPRLFSTHSNRMIAFALDRGDAGVGWSDVELRSRSGAPLRRSAAIPGLTQQMAVETKVNSDAAARRLGTNLSAAFRHSILVFEAHRLNAKTIGQIAGYAVMRVLTGAFGASEPDGASLSILDLFDDETLPAEGLTDFDRAYLTALYGSRANAAGTDLRGAVVRAYADRASRP